MYAVVHLKIKNSNLRKPFLLHVFLNSYHSTYLNILLFNINFTTNLEMNQKYIHGSICLQVIKLIKLYYATLIYTKLLELFRIYLLKIKKEVGSDFVKHFLI